MSDELMKYLPIPQYWRRLLIGAAIFWTLRELTFPLREKKLKGDVVVITGGGSGIGRLMALRLGKEGCKVAILDLNFQGAQDVANEINKAGGVAKGFLCDVSDATKVYACAKEVLAEFGRCDILINNAGIVSGKKLLEESDKLTELTVKVNTIGLMWTLKAFLPGMIERKKGHVVNIASSAGRVGVAGLVSYCASKFGAVGVDESLRQELNQSCPEIKTTCVCPMYIDTGMFSGAKMQSTIPIFNPIVQQLMPVLKPEYVADKIISAIKRNQTVLVMPKFAYLSYLVRATMPTGSIDILYDILGVSRSMEDHVQLRKHE